MATRDHRLRPRSHSRGPTQRGGTAYDQTTPPTRSAPPPASSPPPRADWRGEIAGLSGLNIIAGIWLIIAPWVLGYSARDPRWNDVVFGIIVAVIAVIRATGAYRADWLSWINAAIGVWLFIAAFTIDHTATASWNDVILGIIVLLLAIGSAEATSHLVPRRRGPAQPRL